MTKPITIDNQLPMTGVPEERHDASIIFPTYSTKELPAKRDAMMQLPLAFRRTGTGLNAAWGLFAEQWMAAVSAQAALMEREGDEGSVKIARALRKTQAKLARQIEEHKMNPQVSSVEYTDENIPEIMRMITEETKQIELNRLPTKKSEVFWSKGVKLLFVVPQLMMFAKAIHLDPSRSILFGIGLGFAAYGLASVYQLIARPIMECIAALAGKPTERSGEAPLKTGGIITQLVTFSAGFITVVSCAAVLDATVIVEATKLDKFGQKNPTAIPFSTALAIAGSFSGMLALASLAIARLDRDVADIVRMIEEKVGTMMKTVAPVTEKLRSLEGELVVERHREAEVFASARYEWNRLYTALYLMSKSVSDDAIIRFLMMPHDPIEPADGSCATNVTPTPRAGFGAKLRGLFGKTA
jgi:hypothetical protein